MRANKNGVNKDQKDKVKKDGYNRGQHCVYCLTYHMIFVTHYRKPVINDEMSAAMKEFSNHMAEQFRGKVLSAETDRDHIHLLVSLPPNTNISVFVRSIKTMMVALFVIGAFIPRTFLRTAGVFCAESL